MSIKRHNDIVVSSRVRLARNIADTPFIVDEKSGSMQKLAGSIHASLGGERGGYALYNGVNLSILDGKVLKEKRLISEDFLANTDISSLILNEAETISIMIGEEDHIRLQCILEGANLKEAFRLANQADDLIAQKVQIAFSERLGYLTACPTNLGTGLRASALMFLPALSIFNSLSNCVNAIARHNMAIRGVYGEGSDSTGYLYQLSNQLTLGLTEEEILQSVEDSVAKISDTELKARELLINEGGSAIRDKIGRAYGTLLYAYTLESSEFMQAIAMVKLGIYYGFIKCSDYKLLEKLIIDAQPASLQSLSAKELSTSERDEFRAKHVAKVLRAISK